MSGNRGLVLNNKALVWLKDATNVTVVGGKAKALSSMIHGGFKVPEGFVLSADAYDVMNPDLDAALLDAFDSLGASFVAVRSSAINEDGMNAAWAGQLDTFLNCSRLDLVLKVKRCLKSAETARAKAYALQRGIEATAVAVIVQEMIDSDVSGVAFSRHPITGAVDQVVIEAGFGLGEAIVSGQVTPDTYTVSKRDGQIISKHMGIQQRMLVRGADGENAWEDLNGRASVQKLSDEQIIAVCELTRGLEEFFGYPVDVEWATKNGTIHILQCRPITTGK